MVCGTIDAQPLSIARRKKTPAIKRALCPSEMAECGTAVFWFIPRIDAVALRVL
jgi:hypothetical protein